MRGIDVSQHNGNINWDKVKGQIDFAILRLGWIGNKNNHTIDTKFERNYNECKRLGIPVGVYVYCYSNNEDTVRSGAEWTVNQLNGKSLELPVYIDMEDDTIKGKGKDALTNICIAFNTVIEQSGRWAGVYANRDWFDNYLHKDIIKGKYTTWIATYIPGTDKYKGEYDIWQNSSNGSVEGINGRVDTNYMYRDLIEEINPHTLRYRSHLQDIGWTDFVNEGEVTGTTGESRRLEAIQIEATDLQYRVHLAHIGWTDWYNAGEIAGTTGESRRLEAIEFRSSRELIAQAHVQNIGWQDEVKGKNITIGTTGQSLRMEAFKLRFA